MGKIRSEIEQLMQVQVDGSGVQSATFCFPSAFSGFQGHFSGKPVLPGACQIQCFLTVLERVTGKELDLKEIKLAKYLQPVLPDETITCFIAALPESTSGVFTAKGGFLRGHEKISEIRVYVAPKE